MANLIYTVLFLVIIGIEGNEENDKKCEEYFLNITESIISGSMPSNLSP